MTQHVVVLGRSGAGKSNLCYYLLQQLAAQRVNFCMFDFARRGRDLAPQIPIRIVTPGRPVAPIAFNPFTVAPGLEPDVYSGHVVDVMADAFSLGDGSKSLLVRVLTGLYSKTESPTAKQVLAGLEELRTDSRSSAWKTSAIRAVEGIILSRLESPSNQSQRRTVEELTRTNTVIELDALALGARQFFVPLLCTWFFRSLLTSKKREQLRLVLLIEEAHNVLHKSQTRSRETLMESLMRQGREVGLGMIIVDQSPHLLSSVVLANSYTSVCLNQKGPSDAAKAASLSGLDAEDKGHLTHLSVGHAVVKLQDRWTRPFLLQIPHYRVHKGSVTDDHIRTQHRGRRALSGTRFRDYTCAPTLPDSRGLDGALTPGQLEFLHDVSTRPDDGVDARYRRLKWSTDRGNRTKNVLLASGHLEAATVNTGRTRRTILRLSKPARHVLGDSRPGTTRESVEHEYWKRFWASHFEGSGYEVEMEAPRANGRVDIRATRGHRRVAIEVETGRSDAVKNVKNCLRSGFSLIVVVATDEGAAGKVLRGLAQSRLIIPKVRLVTRDEQPW
jgi:hypothetical protein